MPIHSIIGRALHLSGTQDVKYVAHIQTHTHTNSTGAKIRAKMFPLYVLKLFLSKTLFTGNTRTRLF